MRASEPYDLDDSEKQFANFAFSLYREKIRECPADGADGEWFKTQAFSACEETNIFFDQLNSYLG